MKTISNKGLSHGCKRVLFASLLTLMSVASQAQTTTPSQCKGLANGDCASNNACSWVEGYERKDGREVSAFCRSKPKSKSTTSTDSSDNTKS